MGAYHVHRVVGGKHLTYMNVGADFNKQLAIDRANSVQMLEHFYKLAKRVVSKDGAVSFEWPRFCAGWDLPTSQQIISEFTLFRLT